MYIEREEQRTMVAVSTSSVSVRAGERETKREPSPRLTPPSAPAIGGSSDGITEASSTTSIMATSGGDAMMGGRVVSAY